MRIRAIAFCLTVLAATSLYSVAATTLPTTAPASPDLHTDGRVTLYFKAPKATAVTLGGMLSGAMHKGAKGLWSITVGPLPPNVYYYDFRMDGAVFADPQNPWNHNGAGSLLLVPSPANEPAKPWEITDVPHGSLQIEYYTSRATPGHLRRCHVYTPPGYDPQSDKTYPTLYLLHGHGDNDSSWTGTGRANFMLDNLIATGAAQPMVVVMPDGGSLYTMTTDTFVDDVLHDLIPFVEHRYRVRTDVDHRAVAGLSMGGGHAMHLAFDNPGTFGAVGIWSPGWLNRGQLDWASLLPRLKDSRNSFRTLGTIDLTCGVDDPRLFLVESLDAWLARNGLPHEMEITPGGHAWTVWRAAFLHFAPRLFQAPPKE